MIPRLQRNATSVTPVTAAKPEAAHTAYTRCAMFVFQDRRDAGRRLAGELREYQGQSDVMVIALPRGGVPVGKEIARALHVPIDVLVVRKLGFPENPELTMGAIAGGGVRILSPQVLSSLHMPSRTIETIVAREEAELAWREALYRVGRAPLHVQGKTVLLTDDGVSTGTTMLAAIRAMQSEGAEKVVVAIPAIEKTAADIFNMAADEVVCLLRPEELVLIAKWYKSFPPLSDIDVVRILREDDPRESDDERIPA